MFSLRCHGEHNMNFLGTYAFDGPHPEDTRHAEFTTLFVVHTLLARIVVWVIEAEVAVSI